MSPFFGSIYIIHLKLVKLNIHELDCIVSLFSSCNKLDEESHFMFMFDFKIKIFFFVFVYHHSSDKALTLSTTQLVTSVRWDSFQ